VVNFPLNSSEHNLYSPEFILSHNNVTLSKIMVLKSNIQIIQVVFYSQK